MKRTFFKGTMSVMVLLFAVLSSSAQETKMVVKPAMTGSKPAQTAIQPNKPATSQTSKMSLITPPNSKISAPMQGMMRFMGRWTADATMIVDGKTHQVEYHVTGRGSAEGSAMYIDEFFNDSVLGNMKGANLVGYDPNDQKIHWYSVDNQGTTHEHSGTWGSPDSLHLEHNSVIKGKNYTEKIDFVFASRDEIKFKLVATLDGKETQRDTGVFRREKQVQKEMMKPAPPVEKK